MFKYLMALGSLMLALGCAPERAPEIFFSGSHPTDGGAPVPDGGDAGLSDDGGIQPLSDGGEGEPDAGIDGGPTCTTDSSCPTGMRCCADDQHCHWMVGAGESCDCAHPCPLSQGCLSGACDTAPRVCRPGCFPGGPPDSTHPYGIAADNCAPQGGQPAYCEHLPQDQVNSQNKGGACASANNCSVALQDCPDLPVDRTRPAGPDNPNIPQTCLPVAPGINSCQPAGDVPAWGINCDQTCSNSTSNCAKGYECVSLADSSGARIGPSVCRKQCSNPGADSSSDCPSNRSACSKVYVLGMRFLSTGVCQEDPCYSNADCRSFAATPCCNSRNVCDVCP